MEPRASAEKQHVLRRGAARIGATPPCSRIAKLMPRITRRAFLAGSAVAPFATPLASFASRLATARDIAIDGYGPLRPVEDRATGLPLLALPEGFWYVSFGWTGDPLDDDTPTPGTHDGMAAFAGPDDLIILVRNHELDPGQPFAPNAYDPHGGGGTTTLIFDPRSARVISMTASLGGTLRNCAGGATPWGSWLSCEETVLGPARDARLHQQHGYVFEVPSRGPASAEPLRAMGCFMHEAAAVDPATSIVYMTEDQGNAGLYRFVPDRPEELAAGGKLQMLAIPGRARYNTRAQQRVGERLPIRWVDIPEPDRPHDDPALFDARGVQQQGLEQGAAVFARLEGAHFGDGVLHVISTSGGNARMGQVWELDEQAESLRLVFESPGPDILNMPDNVCMSPRGALVLCEDGTRTPAIHGLTRDGGIFRFASNNIVLRGERNGLRGNFTGSEFCGATFSPDGTWLFVNAQEPGITFAITGPWELGAF
jgi:uncharacterized protein